MKKYIYSIFIFVMAGFLSGCYTTGLSMRERGSVNYSNFIYGLYDEETKGIAENIKLKKPLRLAVAQVGENAPPEAMLNALAEKKYLISKLAVIPAWNEQNDHYGNQKEFAKEEFSTRMTKMRNLAKDLGTDYMFLFGGSADYGTSANWLQFFDMTIIGGFVVPSNKIKAEGRAAGALIDVHTGRVVFVVNAHADQEERAPSFVVYDRQEDVVVRLRDQLVQKLTLNLINELAS